MLAWKMYSDDNEDLMPASTSTSYGAPEWSGMGEGGSGAPGWLDLPVNHEGEINPALTVSKSPIMPYLGGATQVFRDPADKSGGSIASYRNGEWTPRVRSYSMNNWIGGDWGNSGTEWRSFRKSSDLIDPAPSNLWVLITEREDSINDEFFVVDMKGYPSGGRSTRIVDYPASYHGGAGALAFADGHAEIKKWLDGRTMPQLQKGQELQLDVPSPGNQDVFWMQQRSTSRKDGL